MKYVFLAIPILLGFYAGWKLIHKTGEGEYLPLTPERKRLLIVADRHQREDEYSEMVGI